MSRFPKVLALMFGVMLAGALGGCSLKDQYPVLKGTPVGNTPIFFGTSSAIAFDANGNLAGGSVQNESPSTQLLKGMGAVAEGARAEYLHQATKTSRSEKKYYDAAANHENAEAGYADRDKPININKTENSNKTVTVNKTETHAGGFDDKKEVLVGGNGTPIKTENCVGIHGEVELKVTPNGVYPSPGN